MSKRHVAGDKPEPVSLRDGEQARKALAALGRVDIDAYLSMLDVDAVLERPLGPTAECLTLTQLESYDFRAITSVPHIASCDACARALRAYRAVKERSLVEPDQQVLTVEIADMIDLVASPSHFNVMLLVDSALDVQPGDLKVAHAAFKEIRCSAIEMVDVGTGSDGMLRYKATCVASPNLELLRSSELGMEFVDWIEVSGTSKAGKAFAGCDLARFTRSAVK